MPGPDDIFTGPPNQNETIPLSAVVQQAILSSLLELHTWQPAQITKIVDSSHVNIQLLLQRKYADGTLVTLPEVQNVPVQYLCGNDYWIKPPFAVGDEGIAIFCERNLEKWNVAGGLVNPDSTRHHSITDAAFIPGIRPKSNPVDASNPDDMVLHNAKAEIYLQKGGTFKITNGTVELFTLLNELLLALQSALTVTGIGPQPFMPDTIDEFTLLQEQLITLLGR